MKTGPGVPLEPPEGSPENIQGLIIRVQLDNQVCNSGGWIGREEDLHVSHTGLCMC